MDSNTSRNGALQFLADMGFLALVILIGSAGLLWFLTQPENSQRAIVEYAKNLSTGGFIVLMAQPVVFLTYKIANGSLGRMSMRRRMAFAIAVFVGLAVMVPTASGWYLQSFLDMMDKAS